jgi:hypothetical protein
VKQHLETVTSEMILNSWMASVVHNTVKHE